MPLGSFRLNSLARLLSFGTPRTAKTVTASGNAQVSTAQSKLGSSSALFDGTGDYLTVTTNDFDLSKYKGASGQYTIEGFVRIGNMANTSITGANYGNLLVPTMIGNNTPGSGYHFWSFGPVSDGRVGFYYYTGSSNGLYTTGVTLTTNVWYHVAFVYNAGVGKIYVDGVERASATLATDAMYEISTAFTIGQTQSTSFNGYMDEIRVSKTARYTAGFTPTTTQFVDDNNTALLLHCEGANASTTFTDDATSGNYSFTATAQRPKSITARGNAKVSTAQSKFGGASALFDGTGDYLFVDSTQDLNHGTGDFTIEFQVRFSSTTTAILVDYRSANLQGPYPAIYWTSSTIRFYQSSADRITSSSLSLNTWYHVAVTRSGTSTRMFINGTQAGSTYTDSTNYVIGGRLLLGADSIVAGNSSLNGYMDEVRISNTARYTAAFTAPNAAFTTDANTLLLVHCDGANNSTTFTDDTTLRTAKTVTASGNAQVSTAQSQFGGASILFDGTGDRLTVSGNNDVLFWNTQPFTVEYWCRVSGFATSQANDDPTIIGNMDSTSDADFWSFGPDNSGNLTFKYWNGANNTVKAAGTMNLNQWYHCAAVISGNTIRIYLDGVQQNSAAISGTPQFGTGYGGLNIGWGRSSANMSYNGYLDEIRISNLARYPSGTTFTPSTTPFVNDGNTILLIHGNGVNASTTFTDDNA